MAARPRAPMMIDPTPKVQLRVPTPIARTAESNAETGRGFPRCEREEEFEHASSGQAGRAPSPRQPATTRRGTATAAPLAGMEKAGADRREFRVKPA